MVLPAGVSARHPSRVIHPAGVMPAHPRRVDDSDRLTTRRRCMSMAALSARALPGWLRSYERARLSRPSVGALARDPSTGAWGRIDHHPDWAAPDGVLAVRSEGPLMYPNANAVKDRVLALTAARRPARSSWTSRSRPRSTSRPQTRWASSRARCVATASSCGSRMSARPRSTCSRAAASPSACGSSRRSTRLCAIRATHSAARASRRPRGRPAAGASTRTADRRTWRARRSPRGRRSARACP